MRKIATALILAALALPVAAHADIAPPRRTGPDLSRCPSLPRDPENHQTARAAPLPIPPALNGIARSNRDRIGVLTLTSATYCLDARDMLHADRFELSTNGRFLSFTWTGFEADGHVIVDRTGRGQQIETGVPPVFSPSGNRLAAVQISEAAFGGLEGFAVWQVQPTGLSRLTFLDNLPQMEDWRIDGWAGEACINLSARAFGRNRNARRVAFAARPGARGWAVTRTAAGCGRGRGG
jgi:hypothetical protein